MTPAWMAGIAVGLLLTIYIFLPSRDRTPFTRKTRLDFLEERRASVYDNLRDLNFEFRAGKYPEQDYRTQRESLENEAATLLQEMDLLRSLDRKTHA